MLQSVNFSRYHGTPAIIEDDVYIGPNVCLVENIRIGHHSSIGAGAVAIKDIPPYSVAAGVPAKVIKQKSQLYK